MWSLVQLWPMSHKLHVTIPDTEYRRLKELSDETGASIGELVRRALKTTHRAHGEKERRLAAFDAGFGAWSERPHREDSYAEIRARRPKVEEW